MLGKLHFKWLVFVLSMLIGCGEEQPSQPNGNKTAVSTKKSSSKSSDGTLSNNGSKDKVAGEATADSATTKTATTNDADPVVADPSGAGAGMVQNPTTCSIANGPTSSGTPFDLFGGIFQILGGIVQGITGGAGAGAGTGAGTTNGCP